MKGLNDWAARHEKVAKLGEIALGTKFIDLVEIARTAKNCGGDVREGEWKKVYDAAYEANVALRKAAYLIGYQLSEDKPPEIGPAWVL